MIKKDIYQDIIKEISDKTANKIISENLQHARNFEGRKKLVIFMIPARKAELHDSANKTRQRSSLNNILVMIKCMPNLQKIAPFNGFCQHNFNPSTPQPERAETASFTASD